MPYVVFIKMKDHGRQRIVDFEGFWMHERLRVIDRSPDPFAGFRHQRAEWFFHATSKRVKRCSPSKRRLYDSNPRNKWPPETISECLVCAQQVTQSHSYIYVYIQFDFSTRQTYSAQD